VARRRAVPAGRLPVTALQPTPLVNTIWPPGDDLRARLPRVQTWARIPGQGTEWRWLQAGSWCPWLELFQEAGYAPTAPGWPGDPGTVEESRRDPGQVAGTGIDDVAGHYARIIRGLEAPPVVIGHSFGGLIAQRLPGQDLAAAAVAIDAAPIKGVPTCPFPR